MSDEVMVRVQPNLYSDEVFVLIPPRIWGSTTFADNLTKAVTMEFNKHLWATVRVDSDDQT